MSGRVGLGFVNSFAAGIPAVSLKYGLSKDTAVLGAFGISTQVPTNYVFAGKFFKNIFIEQNLTFYSAFGVAAVKATKSGFELQPVIGSEFFIPGIESLGLTFEAGLSATNASGDFIAKTVGYIFSSGVHFYF